MGNCDHPAAKNYHYRHIIHSISPPITTAWNGPINTPQDLIIHLPLIPCQTNSSWKCLLFCWMQNLPASQWKNEGKLQKRTIPRLILNFLADSCRWSTWEAAVRLFCPPSPLSLLPNTRGIIPPQQLWEEYVCHTVNTKKMRTSLIRAEPPWEGAGWWEIGRGSCEGALRAPCGLLWGIQIWAATGWAEGVFNRRLSAFLPALRKIHLSLLPPRVTSGLPQGSVVLLVDGYSHQGQPSLLCWCGVFRDSCRLVCSA